MEIVLPDWYRIKDTLGTGGMGVVVRAQDTNLDREVAIKILHEGAYANDEERRDFRNEARSASQLNHPNIALVYHFDCFLAGPTTSCWSTSRARRSRTPRRSAASPKTS